MPLLLIGESLNQLSSATIYTKLDIRDASLSFVGCGYHVTGCFTAIKLDINKQDTVSSLNFKMSQPISKQ